MFSQAASSGKRPGTDLAPTPKKPRKIDHVDLNQIQGDVLAEVAMISIKGGALMLKIMTQNKVCETCCPKRV
jgi:hypothetical protein